MTIITYSSFRWSKILLNQRRGNLMNNNCPTEAWYMYHSNRFIKPIDVLRLFPCETVSQYFMWRQKHIIMQIHANTLIRQSPTTRHLKRYLKRFNAEFSKENRKVQKSLLFNFCILFYFLLSDLGCWTEPICKKVGFVPVQQGLERNSPISLTDFSGLSF